MTKNQRQRRKERRRLAVERGREELRMETLRRSARRRRPKPTRFWAGPNRSWLMVRTMPNRAHRAVEYLRGGDVPVFEAKAATRFITARGQQRDAIVAVLKRTLFVGITSLSDLVRVENCVWVAKVYATHEDGDGWVDRSSFRSAWIESETFGGRRMPVIEREAMQRFADHVTGHLKADQISDEDDLGPLFETGVSVRVTDGPFASFVGIVDDHDPKSAVYSVAVNIFGNTTPVDLPEESLEAA